MIPFFLTYAFPLDAVFCAAADSIFSSAKEKTLSTPQRHIRTTKTTAMINNAVKIACEISIYYSLPDFSFLNFAITDYFIAKRDEIQVFFFWAGRDIIGIRK
jgi:hypothetical protein